MPVGSRIAVPQTRRADTRSRLMKNIDNNTIARLGALVLAVLIAGCASTPLQRQDATSSSLVDLRDSMIATRGQIQQTLASLDALTNASPDHLRAAYQKYAND